MLHLHGKRASQSPRHRECLGMRDARAREEVLADLGGSALDRQQFRALDGEQLRALGQDAIA